MPIPLLVQLLEGMGGAAAEQFAAGSFSGTIDFIQTIASGEMRTFEQMMRISEELDSQGSIKSTSDDQTTNTSPNDSHIVKYKKKTYIDFDPAYIEGEPSKRAVEKPRANRGGDSSSSRDLSQEGNANKESRPSENVDQRNPRTEARGQNDHADRKPEPPQTADPRESNESENERSKKLPENRQPTRRGIDGEIRARSEQSTQPRYPPPTTIGPGPYRPPTQEELREIREILSGLERKKWDELTFEELWKKAEAGDRKAKREILEWLSLLPVYGDWVDIMLLITKIAEDEETSWQDWTFALVPIYSAGFKKIGEGAFESIRKKGRKSGKHKKQFVPDPHALDHLTKAQKAAAKKLLGQKMTNPEIRRIGELWESVAREGDRAVLSKSNSRRLFNNQRKRFWNAIRRRENADVKKMFEEMGAIFDNKGAPYLKTRNGSKIKLSIDHITERQRDFKLALDASNLRITTLRENTVFLRLLNYYMPNWPN